MDASEIDLLWKMYLIGAWGNFGIMKTNYHNFCIMHNYTECFIAANKKNYKPKKPPAIDEYLYELTDFVGYKKKEKTLQETVKEMFGVK